MRRLLTEQVWLLGIGIGVLYWIIESFADTLVNDETFTERLWPGDLNELWMRITIVALVIVGGAYAQSLINRRRRTEMALRDSEASTRAILDTAPDAIVTATEAGLVRSFNRGAERIFGYEAAEIVGKPLSVLMPERLREAHVRGFRRYLQTGEARVIGRESVELAGLRKNGEELPLELTLGESREGESVLFTGVIRDITDRKAAEEKEAEQTRLVLLQFEIGAALGEGGDLREILQRCAGVAYERLDTAFFRIWTLNKEEQVLELQASAGTYTHLDGPHSRVPVGHLKIGLIAEERQPQLTNDVLSDPRVADKEWARREGMVAFAGYPMVVEDRLVGVMAAFARRSLGEETREALAHIAAVIAQGIERKRAAEEVRGLNESLERRVQERTAELETTVRLLRSSEERYALVLEGTNDGVWEWTVATGEVFWNDRFYRILGLSPSEISPNFELFVELVHPDDRQRVLDALTAHFERGETYEEEFRMRHASGEYRHCLGRGKATWDGERNPHRMAGSVTDITGRKCAEEEVLRLNADLERRVEERTAELAESEERFRSLADATLEAIVVSERGNILEVNRAYTDIFGYEAHEVIGESLMICVAPEFRDLVREHLSANHQEPYEIVGLRKSGERFDMEVHGRAFLYQGRTVRVAAVRDVTVRKRAEEALQKSEASLTEAQRMAHLGNWEWDMERGEVAWSDEVFRIYGYKPGAFVPTLEKVKELVHPDDRAAFREAMEEIVQQNVSYDHTHRIVRPDGVERTVYRRARIISDDAGNPVRMVGTVQDVTERRRAEEELERAREAAEEANRTKSGFLANMSHEIRTPMNGVIGMTGLLLDTDLDAEQRDYAETVRSSGENLLTIINDILDFSKIEAGKLELEIMDFELRNTVEDVLGLLAERAFVKRLELAHMVEPGVPDSLRCDPGRLTQILTNLIGNAIKFTDSGEVVLRVLRVSPAGENEGGEEGETDARLRFEVTDTGIGMTGEQISTLFQSFSQADVSTTRRFGGTGLGLAISKQLVEMMNGRIGVQSEPGEGSTFWFEIPFELQPAGARKSAIRPRTDLHNLRVLVVDDNATNRQLVHHHVISWGMSNGTAEDGESALEALRRASRSGQPYDIAVLDMQMPGMDGVELARNIKADPEISSTELMLLTSLGGPGEISDARQAGIRAYLSKPVRASRLYDTLVTVTGTAEDHDQKTQETQDTQETQESTKRTEPEILLSDHKIGQESTAPRSTSRGRLLLAEDNAINQKLAVSMLRKLSYKVDVASNGLEVLEALSRISYDAILMDCHMPEMDGYEATREIRDRERGQEVPSGVSGHIPVIALTASAMQGDREKALEAGMDGYVTKPIRREILQAALERWISRGKLADAGAAKDAAAGSTETPPSAVSPEVPEHPLDRDILDGLRELAEGEPGLLGVLVEAFLEDAQARIANLREAVEQEDAWEVKVEAHTLKGSAASMGAPGMADLCEELQKTGDSGELAHAPELLGALEKEFERVRPALEYELEAG